MKRTDLDLWGKPSVAERLLYASNDSDQLDVNNYHRSPESMSCLP